MLDIPGSGPENDRATPTSKYPAEVAWCNAGVGLLSQCRWVTQVEVRDVEIVTFFAIVGSVRLSRV